LKKLQVELKRWERKLRANLARSFYAPKKGCALLRNGADLPMCAGLRRTCAYPGLREFKNSQLLARLVRGVALVAESFEVR